MMDRRGLRRTKAAHINPIPLFVMAILLYVTNLVFWDNEAQWWSFPVAFLLTLITGFSVFLIQSRFAENSSPVYFAVYLFLISVVPQTAIFDKGIVAAFSVALAFVFTIKYICEDKQRDYIACTAFSCILASIITPSCIWLLPLFLIIILEESDEKFRDTLIFVISSVITGIIIFGVLFLFSDIEGATETILNWQKELSNVSITGFREIEFSSGLFADWKSMQFAGSITKCLVMLVGIIITIIYLSRKGKLKYDDTIIAKVCLLITLFSVALNYFYSGQQHTYWPIITAMMSVPTTHIIAGEGKHLIITICFVLVFLCAILSLIPLLELL